MQDPVCRQHRTVFCGVAQFTLNYANGHVVHRLKMKYNLFEYLTSKRYLMGGPPKHQSFHLFSGLEGTLNEKIVQVIYVYKVFQ